LRDDDTGRAHEGGDHRPGHAGESEAQAFPLRPGGARHGRPAASERSTVFMLSSRSVPAATAAAMLGNPMWDSSTISPA
jgi:hypothetical protein